MEGILDVAAPIIALEEPTIDGTNDEEVEVGCVIETGAVLSQVEEYRVSAPLNHVVFAVRVTELEEAGPGELSQSQ